MAYNPWKLGYGLNAGTVVDPLPAVPNQGLPQSAGAAQQQWEDYMASSGKSPAGFGGKGLSDAELAAQGRYTDDMWKKLSEAERIQATLPKMRDVLEKYNDPRWKKFIDAAGINIDKVKAFVDANSVAATPAMPSDVPNQPATNPIPDNGQSQSIYPSTTAPDLSGVTPYRPPQPYKGVDRSAIPQLGAPDAGTVTTPGTMPNVTQPMANAPKIGRGMDRPLGNNPLDVGSILPNQGTNRGYKPNRRRYF